MQSGSILNSGYSSFDQFRLTYGTEQSATTIIECRHGIGFKVCGVELNAPQ
jgi:hypothetical protein